MSYRVTWSDGTKDKLRAAVMAMKKSENSDRLVDTLTEHIEQHVGLYPQDANARPGQCVTGKYLVFGCNVHYMIHMDTGDAVITAVEPQEKTNRGKPNPT
jgi:hypothetical protein